MSENEEMKKQINYVGEAIKAIQEKEGKKRGVSGTIKCPKCGKDLRCSIAECNGHIWGCCDGRDLSWAM